MFNYQSIIINILCISIACVLQSGCASQKNQKTLNTFDERTRLYGRLLRWKEYEAAANMIRHKDESPVTVNLDDYKELRIVDYKIKHAQINEDYKTAKIDAEISYYYETQNQVKTIRDSQDWWYFEEAENWFLDGSFPSF